MLFMIKKKSHLMETYSTQLLLTYLKATFRVNFPLCDYALLYGELMTY